MFRSPPSNVRSGDSNDDLAAGAEQMTRQLSADSFPSLAEVIGVMLKGGYNYGDEFE